jgi:hypothetical protein
VFSVEVGDTSGFPVPTPLDGKTAVGGKGTTHPESCRTGLECVSVRVDVKETWNSLWCSLDLMGGKGTHGSREHDQY